MRTLYGRPIGVLVTLSVLAFWGHRDGIAAEPSAEARPLAIPVGAAKIDITPDYPVRLSGYGNRRLESEGVAQRLWAKALALGDGDAGPAVLITVENCGMTPAIAESVAQRLHDQAGVRRERLAISASHSHSAPCLTNWAPFLFGIDIPLEHQKHIDQYTAELTDKMTAVALQAIANRRAARLSWAHGKVGFAANRRALSDGRWTGFGVQADGPVDHSLPVLAATGEDGKLVAVVANYACHCTTLGGDFNQIAGDWAGYAQEYLEADHPGAVALITIGCGADANPNPRGNLELCKQHGRAFADEVNRVLSGKLAPLDSAPECKFTQVDLPFATLPTQEQWQQQAKEGGAAGYHARQFLNKLAAGEKIPTLLSYPIGTWTFGDRLAMVFLGGEVVVDYAIRMKTEFDADRLWITAYSNDVCCYIASRRVLREGGYEADFSMLYYARPTRWADDVEDLIVRTVHQLVPPQFETSPANAALPPPLPPEQSLAAIHLRPGLQAELVAAEPLVVDPVAFDWGPDGRLWVVEMRDYPLGIDGHGKPGGRIKVLSDEDRDGRYDKAEVFLDDIGYPTGLKVWRRGVLVTAAPEIFYAEDTDGDGRADLHKTLFRGFGEGNQQHRINGLRWGLDNWLYLANGESGGNIESVANGQTVNSSGRDLRIRPDTGQIEAQSGLTQFGRDCDDWGNWFGGNNSNPLWHYVLDDHYLRRNPQLAPPDARHQVPVQPGAAPVFPASRTLARFNDFSMANRFTSACSPIVYRDDLLPGGAFVCEPVHNLVHREVLAADGVTFTSRRADDEQQSEFFASADNWCRPVMVRTGPDGALWVADMYRLVIEHPQWIPRGWQERLNLRAGEDCGRIYRLVPTDKPLRPTPRLDKLDTAGLVAALASPNGTLRDMAQQMLVWQGDRHAVPLLEELATSGPNPLARLHALCTLDGLDALSADVVTRALTDEHPGVRRHAIRLSERLLDGAPQLGEALLARLDDPDPQVRLQLAYSLGEWHDPQAARCLATLAVRNQSDRYFTAAVLSSVNKDNVADVLTGVLAAGQGGPPEKLVEQLLGMAAAFGDNSVVLGVLHRIATPNDGGQYERWQMAALAGLLDDLDRRKSSLAQLTAADSQALELRQSLERLYVRARSVALDDAAEPPNRIVAVRLLGRGLSPSKEDVTRLAALLIPQNSFDLQSAAVVSLARLRDASVSAELLEDWESHSPALRSQILDALLSRAAWTSDLLYVVETRRISAAQFDARRRQQLLSHPSDVIRVRSEKIFAAASSADRQKVLDQYLSSLTLAADAARGKEVFAKRCAVCHRLEETGFAVGPDLAALTDRSPQALLAAILDPNRAVEDRYLDYIAVTTDGRQLTGILTLESGNIITLRGSEGKEQVVLRGDLEQLRSTGKSLMPEGVEQDVTQQDLADIIEYLRTAGPPPKEFAGNRPETVRAGADGAIDLSATNCQIYGPRLVFEEKYRNLGWWANPGDRAVWSLIVPAAGRYRVSFDYACDRSAAGNRYVLTVGDQSLRGVVESTGTWDDYRETDAGTLELSAGAAELVVRSEGPIQSALFDLRTVHLVPLRGN